MVCSLAANVLLSMCHEREKRKHHMGGEGRGMFALNMRNNTAHAHIQFVVNHARLTGRQNDFLVMFAPSLAVLLSDTQHIKRLAENMD